MTVEREFAARLAVGDVTVCARDVAMLRAIDRHGSMQGAADALDRSYPHLQRRVVELEAATGTLTERVRGGADGGGTELTDRARDLVRQFARLRAELSGVAAVTESVLAGPVVARDGAVGSVRTDAGTVTALVPERADTVEVCIRSDAVVLRDPARGVDGATSLRNDLAGTVVDVDAGESMASVTVELDREAEREDAGPELVALVTAASLARLELEPGRAVVASFKATAARGVDPSA
jgi:molybdate transport system regulatory protein